ncbi:hypothetical protein PMIN04_010847 [Paraphaeosphaeria minitans]
MSTSFERPSVASSRQNSTSSNASTLSKTWMKVKEHHDSMNDAFATYYGGRRAQEPWNTSPRSSVTYADELEHEPLVEKKKSLAKKMLGRVKEHHRSVNAAYRAYYG